MTADVDQWVSRLKEAFSGAGTDEEDVQKVLGEAKGQISTLVSSYPNLEDELYDELSGDELKDALRLFYEVSLPPSPNDSQVDEPQWVTRIYTAFNAGLLGGTDEDEVLSVLRAANSAKQMGALSNIYKKKYPDELDLEDELYDELSGDDLMTALKLFYTGFDSNVQPPVTTRKVYGTLIPLNVQLLLQQIDQERAKLGLSPLSGKVTGLGESVFRWPHDFFDATPSKEDVWKKMEDATRLIQKYDRAFKRESKDVRDYLVDPLMKDIFNPIVDWLPLVPESLKPDLRDAISSGLKSGILSLIETAVDGLESVDDNTKKALKETAKAGFNLKFPLTPISPEAGTPGGVSQTNNDSTTPRTGPEEGKPYKAPGEKILTTPSIPVPEPN